MLEIIGIIATLIVIKFVYDTYLTNNTEEEWQKYKKSNPIDAHILELEEKKLDLQEAKRQYNSSVKHFNDNPEKSKKALERAIKLDPENDNYRNLLDTFHPNKDDILEEAETKTRKIEEEEKAKKIVEKFSGMSRLGRIFKFNQPMDNYETGDRVRYPQFMIDKVIFKDQSYYKLYVEVEGIFQTFVFFPTQLPNDFRTTHTEVGKAIGKNGQVYGYVIFNYEEHLDLVLTRGENYSFMSSDKDQYAIQLIDNDPRR